MSTDSRFPVLLNVTLSDREDHCYIKANIAGFRASSVRVIPWDDSLIVEMYAEHEPHQSYYLGEAEQKSYRRVIPLGFSASEGDVMTHYQYGKLSISVAKHTDDNTATQKNKKSYS